MPKISLRESGVIEYQLCLRSPIRQLEFDQRIHARVPVGRTPRLNDPLIGDELYVPSRDQAAKHQKRAAHSSIDLGRHSRKFRKLLRIEQRLIDSLSTRFYFYLLMQIREQPFDPFALRFFDLLFTLCGLRVS